MRLQFLEVCVGLYWGVLSCHWNAYRFAGCGAGQLSCHWNACRFARCGAGQLSCHWNVCRFARCGAGQLSCHWNACRFARCGTGQLPDQERGPAAAEWVSSPVPVLLPLPHTWLSWLAHQADQHAAASRRWVSAFCLVEVIFVLIIWNLKLVNRWRMWPWTSLLTLCQYLPACHLINSCCHWDMSLKLSPLFFNKKFFIQVPSASSWDEL